MIKIHKPTRLIREAYYDKDECCYCAVGWLLKELGVPNEQLGDSYVYLSGDRVIDARGIENWLLDNKDLDLKGKLQDLIDLNDEEKANVELETVESEDEEGNLYEEEIEVETPRAPEDIWFFIDWCKRHDIEFIEETLV